MLQKTLFYILFIFSFCNILQGQSDVKVFNNFDSFEHILHKDNDSIYIVNFWATWCKPCVAELPYFEQLQQDPDLNVILVSLDMVKQLDSKVIPFVKENQILSEVVLLNDTKYNKWIDRVDPTWSGAIPATVFYKGEDKLFLETEFESYDDLHSQVHEFLDTK